MTKARVTLTLVALALSALFAAPAAHAQATRTWVSGVGDDVNPCSRTAPCKTFAGAISKTAAGGEINALDSGGFGAVTITKSMTIDGGGALASILAAWTNGIIINNVNADVTIRNVSINGAGSGINGIRILQANRVSIENVQVFGFTNRGITDERTTGGKLAVRSSIVRNNAQSGIVILPSSGATTITVSIDGTSSHNNLNSGFVAGNGSRVTIRDSVASSNTFFGFVADAAGGASEMNLESVIASGNGTGVGALTNGTVRFSNVHATNSSSNGVSLSGGTFVSYGNNHISGNAGNNTLGVAPLAPQ
jgi:hypothetical protein